MQVRVRRSADQARYLTAHALARLVLADVVGESPSGLSFSRPVGAENPTASPN